MNRSLRDDEPVCVLHNAYNPEDLVESIYGRETAETNHGKDYDKEFDEKGFCRILAAALDSGCEDMDLFYVAKPVKDPVSSVNEGGTKNGKI